MDRQTDLGTSMRRVRSLKNQRLISDKCTVVMRFWSRLKGLMGRRTFTAGEGMLFPRCNSVHMWFMRIPIDVVFLSRHEGENFKVTSIHPRAKPWKLLPLLDFKSSETLELPAGTIERENIEPGDLLCID